MGKDVRQIIFRPDDISALRTVVTVLHDHYELINPLVLHSRPEELLAFKDALDKATPVTEGAAVPLAAAGLIRLNMAVMMAADCHEDLPLQQEGMTEADLQALSERLTFLEEQHFPHLRKADRPSDEE